MHLNTAARQTPRHVAAHAAQTVKTDFQHAVLLFHDLKYQGKSSKFS
jgi:hypothetical protein